MAKLYFKYGAMGSSKTAQALITKYNYEENDMSVWLMKPGTDTRDGESVVKSRIGLKSEAQVIAPDMDVYEIYRTQKDGTVNAVIVDECQLLTPQQIDQLRAVVDDFNVPVMCFGPRLHAPDGSGGCHSGDQDHLRLRRQGNCQCPYQRWLYRHRG